MSNVTLTGDYSTDVKALLELLRDGSESLVVSCQLLESSESVVDRHHAKQNLERWTPIWRDLDRNRGRDVRPAAREPFAWFSWRLKGSLAGRPVRVDPNTVRDWSLWQKPFPVFTDAPSSRPMDANEIIRLWESNRRCCNVGNVLRFARALERGAQPAAQADEPAQYRLLRLGEVILATDELLMDDCTTWQPMIDGPQLGIGREWHAGLVPMRRVEVAERVQGDGSADHA